MACVQTEDFDVAAEIAKIRRRNFGIGAIVSFVGVVRDVNENATVSGLELEHYPAMTEKALREITDQTRRRWNLLDVTVIHRVGKLAPTDQIVLVITAGAHRRDAFLACEFIMDYLKTSAPLWKKEDTLSGPRWVEARADDRAQVGRWEKQNDSVKGECHGDV